MSQAFKFERQGYVHIDLKFLAKLESKVAYMFVAIERNTRYVWVDIITDRRSNAVSNCLSQFIKECPYKEHLHTILTDNGSEFTDRYKTGEDRPPTGHLDWSSILKQDYGGMIEDLIRSFVS